MTNPLCGKQAYASKSEAYETARKVGKRWKTGAMDVYRCRECGAFHLGSSRPGRMIRR